MLFSKQTPAAGGTAFAQFDAAWCYDGNGYILNDTGTSLDVRIGADGSIQTLAAGGTLPIKLVYSLAELYVRRTDQSTTQVTVEAQVGTGSAEGGTSAEVGVIAAATAAAAIAAHNADPAAHGGALSGLLPPLATASPEINRVGTVFNQVALTRATQGSPQIAYVNTFTQPAFSTIEGYIPRGATPGGEAILGDSSKTILLVAQGGARRRTVELNTWLDNIWFDSAQNCYGSFGRNVYRSPAGKWNFELAFSFPAASGGVAPFGYCADDNGGIYVAEYANEPDTGKYVYVSLDYGVTWTSSVVDVGQRHLHGIFWHKYDNKLYLLVGEPHAGDTEPSHQFGKLYVSDDYGATFAYLYTFTEANPTVFSSFGRLILIGTDGGASRGFYVYDPRDQGVRHVDAVQDLYGETTSGFYYQFTNARNGIVWAPAEPTYSGLNTVKSIYMIEDPQNPPIAFITSFNSRYPSQASVVGPDADGFLYYRNVTEDGTLVLPSTEVRIRTCEALVTTSSSGFVASVNFDSSPAVVSGVTFSGLKVLKIAASSAVEMTSAPYIEVSDAKTYRVCFVAKRGTGEAGNFMLTHVWYNGASYISNTSTAIDLSSAPKGEYVKIVSPSLTPPAGATRVVLGFVLWKDASDANSHVVVSGISIFDDVSGDVPWAPSGSASETYTIQVGNGCVVDRVFVQYPPSLWTSGHLSEVITADGVSIGVRYTEMSKGEIVVTVNEATTVIPGCIWGSNIGGSKAYALTGTQQSGLAESCDAQGAPLAIAVSSRNLVLINPETNVAYSFALNQAVSEVVVGGNAVHAAVIHPNAEATEPILRTSI